MNIEEIASKTGVAFVVHEVKYGSVIPSWVSDNFEEAIGHDKKMWLGVGHSAPPVILHPDDHNIIADFMKSMNEKGFYHGFQRHKDQKTGEFFWIYVNFKPLEFDDHGNVSKVVGATFRLDDLLHSQIQTDYFLYDHLKYKKNKLLEKLSPREIEVATLIAEGLTDKEVAEKLVISQSTVKKHRINILKKLGVNSFMKVAKYFFVQ